MFYFTPEEGWKPFKHKLTYPVVITEYSDEIKEIEGLIAEEITLTDEQKARLETVKHVTSVGVDDVVKYVIDGKAEDAQLIDLQSAIKKDRLMQLINAESLTEAEKLELQELIK